MKDDRTTKLMEIRIDNKGFELGGQRFTYSFYFMDDASYNSLASGKEISTRELCQWLLGIWARAIERIETFGGPMFLPFLPDDEDIECLKAEYVDGKITFTHVHVGENGWTLDWQNIEGFITSSHEVCETLSKPAGEFDKVEIIRAMDDPFVIQEG